MQSYIFLQEQTPYSFIYHFIFVVQCTVQGLWETWVHLWCVWCHFIMGTGSCSIAFTFIYIFFTSTMKKQCRVDKVFTHQYSILFFHSACLWLINYRKQKFAVPQHDNSLDKGIFRCPTRWMDWICCKAHCTIVRSLMC